MKREVKVIGIQRSGTNYLSTILEDNYNVTSVDTGRDKLPDGSRKYFWKHSYDPEQYEYGTDNDCEIVTNGIRKAAKNSIPTILITKNPYFWIESIKRNPGDIGLKDISFIKWTNIKTREGKARIPLINSGYFDLENVCRMWNDFHTYWIENSYESMMCVRYEDLLRDPKLIVEKIEKRYNLQKKNQELTLPEKVTMSSKFNNSRIPRFMEEKNPHITEIEKQTMASVLTNEVLDYYGYSHLAH